MNQDLNKTATFDRKFSALLSAFVVLAACFGLGLILFYYGHSMSASGIVALGSILMVIMFLLFAIGVFAIATAPFVVLTLSRKGLHSHLHTKSPVPWTNVEEESLQSVKKGLAKLTNIRISISASSRNDVNWRRGHKPFGFVKKVEIAVPANSLRSPINEVLQTLQDFAKVHNPNIKFSK